MWKKAYLGIFVLLLSAFSIYSYAVFTMNAASNQVKQKIFTRDGASYTAAKSKIYLGEYKGQIIEWEMVKEVLSDKYLLMPSESVDKIAVDVLNNTDYANNNNAYFRAISQFNSTGIKQEETELLYQNDPEGLIVLPTTKDFGNGGTFGMNNYYRAMMNPQADLSSLNLYKDVYSPNYQYNCEYGYSYGNVPRGGIKSCTGTNVKAQINVDLDDDGIPDINIDTNGDMKADLNIPREGSSEPAVNIATIESWNPNKNFKHNKFEYDTVDHKPYLNIDTDGDGRPDINIDTDGDGKADENIIKITEWKPGHNVDDPFPYDTMKFEEKKELEDNGVKVEKPDGTFAPNITLKVTDITKDKQSEVGEKAKDLIGEQSVIQVFGVKLLENGKEIEPDGILKVKIPVKSNIQNPSLLILNEAGEYEKVEAAFEDGYLIYETDRLGQFTVIGDITDQEPTDVGGSYYPGDNAGGAQNVGGALTGDTTNMMIYMGLGCMSIGMMLFIVFKRKQEE